MRQRRMAVEVLVLALVFVLAGATSAGGLTVYRFYNLKNGSHFYTVTPEERDLVIARWPDVYSYEGPAYEVATPADVTALAARVSALEAPVIRTARVYAPDFGAGANVVSTRDALIDVYSEAVVPAIPADATLIDVTVKYYNSPASENAYVFSYTDDVTDGPGMLVNFALAPAGALRARTQALPREVGDHEYFVVGVTGPIHVECISIRYSMPR